LTGWPAPKRILPGRIFIDLSFKSLAGVRNRHPLAKLSEGRLCRAKR
jgi:hypothetical protein